MYMDWYSGNWKTRGGGGDSSMTGGYGRIVSALLDTGDSYLVKLNISSLVEDSIQVKHVGQNVIISAFPKPSRSETFSGVGYKVRRVWTFHVGNAPASDIEAEINNGSLIVSIPKGNAERVIPITRIS